MNGGLGHGNDVLQTQIFTPYFCLISDRYAFGSGKLSGSNVNEHLIVDWRWHRSSVLQVHTKCKVAHHSYCFIQKQSKWNTRTGHFRVCMPSRNPDTVFSSYDVRNEVESQSPYVQEGRRLRKM